MSVMLVSRLMVCYCIKLVSSSSILSNVYGLPLYLLHMIQGHSLTHMKHITCSKFFIKSVQFLWKLNSSVFFSTCAQSLHRITARLLLDLHKF